MSVPPNVQGKFDRANEHLQSFIVEVTEFGKRHPYRFASERNADMTELAVFLEFTEILPLNRWALIVGDCIHNLRSALDHLVYAMAVKQAKTDPPPGESILAFPIGIDLTQFNTRRWHLEDLRNDPGIMTVINGLQPYNRPEQSGLRPLALLEYMDNLDKHRLLNVTAALFQNANYTLTRQWEPREEGQIALTVGSLQQRTEIIRISANVPIPDMKVKTDARVNIAIGHTASSTDGRQGSGAEWLIRTLVDETEYVIGVLSKFT